MTSSRTSLKSFLKGAEERVIEAAVQALNDSAKLLEQDIKANMDARGIQSRTEALRGSVKATKATPKRLSVTVKSEVYKPAPRRPGSRNPRMVGRYKKGVPYGRILEFSPRYRKYNGFFYKAWYKDRQRIKNDVMEAVGNAWSGKK